MTKEVRKILLQWEGCEGEDNFGIKCCGGTGSVVKHVHGILVVDVSITRLRDLRTVHSVTRMLSLRSCNCLLWESVHAGRAVN